MLRLTTGLLSVVMFVFLSGGVHAESGSVEVEGVELPRTLSVDGYELVFNGAGERRRWMMSVYVSALYLVEPSSDAEAILESDDPRAITLHITSGLINRERMMDSIEQGFDAATGGDTSSIQAPIDALVSSFGDEIEDGDTIELLYLPERGVVVRHNDEEVGEVEGEPEFREALFAIWLGDDPASDDLRSAMLGR